MSEPVEHSAFVGRTHDMALMRKMFDEVATGVGRAVVVEGEAGIGKSRLLTESLEAAGAAGFQVYRGRGEELERDRPFGPLLAVSQLKVAVREDPDAVGSLVEPTLRYRTLEAVVELVERAARRAPVLLVVDDAHWADGATLATLCAASERLADLPLGVVVACRPRPRTRDFDRALERLAGVPGERLVLGRLAAGEVADLLAGLVGASPGQTLLDQTAAASGNPLFVTQLLSALVETGGLVVRHGVAEVDQPALPSSLRRTILMRLGIRSDTMTHLLRIASVLGPSPVSDLALMLQRSPAALIGPIEEAIAAGLLVDRGSRLGFRHDLVREVVYQEIPASLRDALHRQAARALADAGRPASQVAAHLSLVAGSDDAEAVEWIRRAAREAAPRAPGIAVELLQRAMKLVAPGSADEAAVLVDLARALVWSGRLEDAEEIITGGLAGGLGAEQGADLHYLLGRVWVFRGRVDLSVVHTRAGLALPVLTTQQRARLLADLALRLPLLGELVEAETMAEDALVLADQTGDHVARSSALSGQSLIALLRGDAATAVARSEEALPRSRSDVTEAIELLQPRYYLAFALLAAERLDEATNVLHVVGRLAEEIGSPWALTQSHAALAFAGWLAGRWDDAMAAAETSLRLAEESGAQLYSLLAHSVVARIALHRTDHRRAAEACAAAHRLVAQTTHYQYFAEHLSVARAAVLEADGSPREAWTVLAERSRWAERTGSTGELATLAPDLVRLGAQLGHAEEAAHVCAGMAEGRVRRYCEGLLAQDAEAVLETADLAAESGHLFDRPTALEQAAAIITHRGDRERAVALLSAAAEGYEKLGAHRDVARTDKALRELGVRRGKRGHRGRPDTGWESLTATERLVVDLMREGLTNREVGERLSISPRTVETHLSHVFAKLNLRSRTQLAATARHW